MSSENTSHKDFVSVSSEPSLELISKNNINANANDNDNDISSKENKSKYESEFDFTINLDADLESIKNNSSSNNNNVNTFSVWDDQPTLESTKLWGFKNFSRWVWLWLIPGLGMFNESYLIFSTGQLKSIWANAYPSCWKPNQSPTCPTLVKCHGLFNNASAFNASDLNVFDVSYCNSDGTFPDTATCDQGLIHAISYSEFAGIMLGMLILACFADRLGRKFGSLATAIIMTVGAILMTLSMPFAGYNTMFTWFTVAYGIYGFGVGGEYPISGSSAAERSQMKYPKEERGREISMTFAMQGVGAVVGSIVILILLLITDQRQADCSNSSNLSTGYSERSLEIVWRMTYGIGASITILMLLYRILFLKESKIYKKVKKMQTTAAKDNRYRYDLRDWKVSYYVAFRYYGSRMIGTAGCWFLWDIAFYGNKLYSTPIFSALVPGGDLLSINGYILLNNVVSLIGYWIAALLVDKKWCGRRRLQNVGFIMCTILFALSAGLYGKVDGSVLLFLYIFSSFWGQCGPNVTTFIVPAEVFPTALRSVCHGISAFFGKAGALLATIIFGYLNTQEIFIICAVVSALSVVFTFFFLPDVTGLDLIENDRYLESLCLKPREKDCLGRVVNPKACIARQSQYLSRFEIFMEQYIM